MLVDYLINNIWPALIIISLVYFSDYYLTLTAARLYEKGAKKHFSYEGGIELNPLYKKSFENVRNLKHRRFIITLIAMNTMTYLLWLLSRPNSPGAFELFLGGFILSEAFVHIRHLRNLAMFRRAVSSDGISGQISYSRNCMHNLARIDAFTFALLYLILAILFWRTFFLGGFITCLSLANAQKKWLKKNTNSVK